MMSTRHLIFKDDTEVDLKKVEVVVVSYVKGFRDEKYRRSDDSKTSKYYGYKGKQFWKYGFLVVKVIWKNYDTEKAMWEIREKIKTRISVFVRGYR